MLNKNLEVRGLSRLQGKFRGEGVNHEGQEFVGLFEGEQIPNGLKFIFQALGRDSTPFHIESSLLGKNLNETLSLYVLSSNHPGIFERTLRRHECLESDSELFVFGFGEPADRDSFREEIHLRIEADAVVYTYFWGLPGGDFAERSGCKMARES